MHQLRILARGCHSAVGRAGAYRGLKTLAEVVQTRAGGSPTALALAAPQQDVRWTYDELSSRSLIVAQQLATLGYSAGDVLVAQVPNSVENLLLQLACSHLGAAVATVKDQAGLDALAKAATVRGVAAHAGSREELPEWLQNLPAAPVLIKELDGTLGSSGQKSAAAAIGGDAPLGYWSSAKPLTTAQTQAMGEASVKKLQMTEKDKVLVTITLCHAFGIGSAVAATLQAGACIILPGSSGIRGCGNPVQRSKVALEALASEKCTLLFADIHTLKALPPAGESDLSSLRGGVCKIGSGSDFLDGVESAGDIPLSYAGVKLLAMGKA